MEENKEIQISSPTEEIKYDYFVGIRFNESGKSYFFSTNEKLLKIADKVVVETSRGVEIGIVSILPQHISTYNFKLDLNSVCCTIFIYMGLRHAWTTTTITTTNHAQLPLVPCVLFYCS